ncbi:hypothetical protein [uncultured Mucilaginibacter sp.]|uniref:hypothetical protein n=1 Tax=uncultured Mucilaginibacter sp. TaxID=797541 RepID=UPI00260444A2|nr:hypothetical protein [uncultured Mucilaginibacter sp.]
MSSQILKFIAVSFISMVYVETLKGQNLVPDTSSGQQKINSVIQNFTTAIGENSRLYNGPEYDQYNFFIKGNAYYDDVNVWKFGSVKYDDVTYNNVPMMYDVYKDCVVVLHYNKAFSYILLNDKLHYFNLADHHFVAVNVDSLNNPGIRNGIYNQLYKGKTEVLTKTSKTIQTGTTGNLESYFSPGKKGIYLKKGTEYYNINGLSSILKALQDKKKQVQLFISDNRIKYKADPEQALVKIASYYDQLSN